MKTFILKSTYLVLISMFIMSCTPDDDAIFTDETSEFIDVKASYTVMEYRILSLINEHRESIGLSSLNIINVVSNEAESHTNYMIGEGEPSHDNFDVRYRNLVNKVNAKSVGENVAYGYSSAEAVVKAWIKSPGHKKTIENTEYTDFGISTKKNTEGKNYFTHIFIKR